MDESQQAYLLGYLSQAFIDGNSASTYFSSAIARLVGLHLRDVHEWSERWVDDVLEVRLEINDVYVEVFGYLVWGKDGITSQWIDPLHAIFTRDGEGKIIRYQYRFCDSDHPSQPYKLHRKLKPTARIKWTYRFLWDSRSGD